MPPKAKKSNKKPAPKEDTEDVVITAGDLTKSTAADTKACKRSDLPKEEAKAPPKKRTARNRTNLGEQAKLQQMAQELDIDLGNVDDEDLKAVLMAACDDSDDDKPKASAKAKEL